MERCGSSPKLTSRILAKVLNGYVTKIGLSECHRLAIYRRFGLHVHTVDEDTHPLVARPVRINSSPCLPRRLHLHTLRSSLDSITGIDSLDNEVWVTVVILIFTEHSGVFCKTGRQHV